MRKALSLLLVFTMILATLSFSIIPASAEELEIKNEDIIFTEKFEDYTANTNWITAYTKNTKYQSIANDTLGVSDKAADSWIYTTSADSIKGGSVKPVTLEGEEHAGRGQVLELTVPDTSSGWITLKRTSNGMDGIARENIPEGKKIVAEVKFFVPDGTYLSEAAILSNPNTLSPSSSLKGSNNGYLGAYATLAAKNTSATFYGSSSGKYGFVQARYNKGVLGEWHTFRLIYDVSKTPSVSHSDTTGFLLDENMYTSYFADATSDGTGYLANEVPASPGGDWYIKDHPTYPMYNESEEGAVKQIDYLNTTSTTKSDGYMVQSKDFVFKIDNFYGAQFSVKNRDGNTGSKYYIDDLKAYYIDALDFEVINASAYSSGAVKLTFNQPLKESFKEYIKNKPSTSTEKDGTRKLEDFFTMIDSEGNTVDGIEKFELSDDKKVVSITPKTTLTKGEDYKIVINPLLIDVYGQGLNKNGHNNATYVDLHIATEAVPFSLESLSQETVEDFRQGRTTEIAANFTKAVKNDDVITSGIVVTNLDDNTTVARNNGWTAELSDNKKTVTFNFTNLPTANYKITANSNFIDEIDEALSGGFEINIKKSDNMIVFFDEDFEDYEENTNWICSENKQSPTSTNSVARTTFDVADAEGNEKAWTVQRHWSSQIVSNTETFDDADDFVGVVAAPEVEAGNLSGNVLKIYNNRGTAYNSNYVAVRRNFNGATGIDLESEEYAGKKLVCEADVYSDGYTAKTYMLALSRSKTNIRDGVGDYEVSFSSNGKFTVGREYRTTFTSHGPTAMNAQVKPDVDVQLQIRRH